MSEETRMMRIVIMTMVMVMMGIVVTVVIFDGGDDDDDDDIMRRMSNSIWFDNDVFAQHSCSCTFVIVCLSPEIILPNSEFWIVQNQVYKLLAKWDESL